MEYVPTIGLEIHVELKTRTKMFCQSLNDPNETHPNTNICPICMGHPGTLPTINREAINKLARVGLALNCQIARFSKFDRKNYFYPDLPKGYQISQYDLPLCADGWLKIVVADTEHTIRIHRIHMEEDTGRLQHAGDGAHSLVDFNRAGVPLMELVTHPDITDPQQIEQFAKQLQLILRYLDASNADMEKGQMRVEVNISVRPQDTEKLGTKVEIKNINSISAAVHAAEYEIKRQSQLLDNGELIAQETRGWDDQKLITFSQRIKEGSADYRYFPEPDLPPMRFTEADIETMRASLPELPEQRRERLRRLYGITAAQAQVFVIARHLGDYFEAIASELASWDKFEHLKHPGDEHLHYLYTLAANYLITELPPLLQMTGTEIDDVAGIKIKPSHFGELIVRIYHKELSSTNAKVVLKEMAETGENPEQIIREHDLGQVSDSLALIEAVDHVIDNNAKAVGDYKKGKLEVLKFLVGQAMAKTRGKANPEVVEQMFKEKLG